MNRFWKNQFPNIKNHLNTNFYFNSNYILTESDGFRTKRRATSFPSFDCSRNELALRLQKNPSLFKIMK